jgi:hypothetical protein
MNFVCARFSICRQLVTLLVWLLLGLQVLTPLVHAHTRVNPVHSGFHLPEFQHPRALAVDGVQAQFSYDDGIAIGVAAGVPQHLPRVGLAHALLPAEPRWRMPQAVCCGAAWAHAPPTIPALPAVYFTPPSQAPPPVLL